MECVNVLYRISELSLEGRQIVAGQFRSFGPGTADSTQLSCLTRTLGYPFESGFSICSHRHSLVPAISQLDYTNDPRRRLWIRSLY